MYICICIFFIFFFIVLPLVGLLFLVETINDALQESIEWLDHNKTAELEEIEAQLKALQKQVEPIIEKHYQAQGGQGGKGGEGGGGGAADDDDENIDL
jgi:predicted PurR-regulated permease PerM